MVEFMTSDTGVGVSLPDYDRPPVVEVTLALVFGPLTELDFNFLADLRARWSSEYPKTQHQPPIIPAPGMAEGLPPFVVEVGVPPIRLWFLTQSEDRVVQVQHDRFITNWRVGRSEDGYPRYETLRREFEERWDDFGRFLGERGLAQPRVLSTEVTYTNAIGPYAEIGSVSLARALRAHSSIDSHLGEPVQENLTFAFDAGSTDSTGPRVLVKAAHDVSKEPPPLVVQISAQGPVEGNNKDVLAALDLGHQHVVRLFDEITSDEMHARWGRRES